MVRAINLDLLPQKVTHMIKGEKPEYLRAFEIPADELSEDGYKLLLSRRVVLPDDFYLRYAGLLPDIGGNCKPVSNGHYERKDDKRFFVVVDLPKLPFIKLWVDYNDDMPPQGCQVTEDGIYNFPNSTPFDKSLDRAMHEVRQALVKENPDFRHWRWS